MRAPVAALAGFGLLGIGYIMGSLNGPNLAFAADEKPAVKDSKKDKDKPEAANPRLEGLTEETLGKLKKLADALKTAQEALRSERKEGYTPITKGVNITSLLVGGLNSRADLESRQGVDPETFAALYANMANDDILPQLQRNPDGLLEYKGKVIRMYSIDRLRKLYKDRAIITGEEVPLTEEEKAAKAREDKAAGKAPPMKKSSPTPSAEKKEEKKEE